MPEEYDVTLTLDNVTDTWKQSNNVLVVDSEGYIHVSHTENGEFEIETPYKVVAWMEYKQERTMNKFYGEKEERN